MVVVVIGCPSEDRVVCLIIIMYSHMMHTQ